MSDEIPSTQDDRVQGTPWRWLTLQALLGGLGTIDEVLEVARRGTSKWGPIVLELREAIADTKDALAQTKDDATLERLRAFAERQLAFASVLEDELVRLEEDESTLA